MTVVNGSVIAAVVISLVASVGLARANPNQRIPQAGNRRIRLFTGAWVVVLAAVVTAVIEGPHPSGLLVPTLAVAPLTVVMLWHNAGVTRRNARTTDDSSPQ